MADRVLRTPEVLEIVGVSSTTLWRWVSAGTFPASRQIGPNVVGWLESEVEEWIAERTATDTARAE